MQQAETPVRADISPSIHPAVLSREAAELATGVGAAALRAGESALAAMYKIAGDTTDAAAAIAAAPPMGHVVLMGNKTPVSSASAGFGDAVDKATARTSKSVDSSIKNLLDFEASLAESVRESVWSPGASGFSEVALFSEVRAHFRGLEDGKRLPAAFAAIKGGDRRTTTALLSAPGFLSGLSDGQLEAIRDGAGEHFAPTEFKQLLATREIANKVRAAGGWFLQHQSRVKSRTVEREAPKVAARRAVAELRAG